MPWIQTHTEGFLVQMERSMQKMCRILLTLELLAMLLLFYLKQFRHAHHLPRIVYSLSYWHDTQFFFTHLSHVLQGVGGVIELAPGYLPAVYSSIRKAGGLCIADEVQVGFARTGSHFWGFEAQGVVPDIVTMAKVLFSLLLSPSFFILVLEIDVHKNSLDWFSSLIL